MECIQLFLAENRKCEVFWADAGTFSHRAEGKQGSDVVRAGMNRGDEVVCRCVRLDHVHGLGETDMEPEGSSGDGG